MLLPASGTVYPARSTASSTLPVKLKIDTAPPTPSGTTIEFGVTWPGVALLAELFGRAWPVGHTVMNESAVAFLSIVMLSSTDTALAGTGALARLGAGVVSGSAISWLAPRGAAAATPMGPSPARVSSTRNGVTPTKPSGSAAAGDTGLPERPGAAAASPAAPTSRAPATTPTRTP